MLEFAIPGWGDLAIEYLFLDVNGTLATDGELLPGVRERLLALAEQVQIVMLTADTHGKQAAIDADLGLTATRVTRGQERQQKAGLLSERGSQRCIAIGNGGNDVEMLAAAAIGIAVIGQEGANMEALQAADVVTTSILDALDLLLKPRRMAATLRR